MIIAAYILISAAVLVFIFQPLFTDQEAIGQASKQEIKRRQLLENREMIYEAIRELDFDYRMGKVEEDDYKTTRARYQARAVEVMKALDKTNGRAEPISESAPSKSIDDQIEQEIAALRKSKKNP
ncbi:MAG: hypothetical protein O7G87_16470 [bacterium]|nr:hypothetical protein [bacterium]